MRYNPDAHRRRSIRLRGYDYAQAGAYFITICTDNRRPLLEPEPTKQIVCDVWKELPDHYPHVRLDAFVIMPNHVHGIIVLADVGAGLRPAPTPSVRTRRHGLPEIVRAFKSFSSRRLNANFGTPGARLWQRNYYEHVIRTDDALNRIRQYILDNPARWGYDRDNPLGQPDKDETAFWETLGPGGAHLPRG